MKKLQPPTAFTWSALPQLSRLQLPDAVRPWLLDRGSLTQRLIDASNGDFRVQLLSQGWGVPTRDEAEVLDLKPRQQALIREVLLICNGTPWVYARSIIPFNSLQGELGFLRKLRDSALGALLFKDPNLQRSRFQLCHLQLPHHDIPVDQNGAIYGRRSLFHLQQQPLLVAEYFLPECRLERTHNSVVPLSAHGKIGL